MIQLCLWKDISGSAEVFGEVRGMRGFIGGGQVCVICVTYDVDVN